MRRFDLLGLTVALVGLSGCATTVVEDVHQDLSDIRSELSRMQSDADQTRQQLESIDGKVSSQRVSTRSDLAEVTTQLDDLEAKMQLLIDRLEDTNYRLSGLSRDIQVARDVLRTPTPSRPLSNGPVSVPVAVDDPAASWTSSGSGEPQDLFDGAYADFVKGEFSSAISGFGDYLAGAPDGVLAGDAQYWIGESYYGLGDYRKAIAEFDKLLGLYPNGDKVAMAHLKKGFSYLEMHQTAQGVVQLNYLIENYPLSDEARLAVERLREMGLRE